MKRVLFVAGNPSPNRDVVTPMKGTREAVVFGRWLDFMEIQPDDYDIIYASNEITSEQDIVLKRNYNHELIKKMRPGYRRFVAVGSLARKVLKISSVPFYCIPYPYITINLAEVQHVLMQCKRYLKS